MKKDKQSGASFAHIGCYGSMDQVDEYQTGPIPDDFTLNTPVGICMDKNQNLWVCDTGNSRVIVFDSKLKNILHVLPGPGAEVGDGQEKKFLMPFHACQHPEKQLMYITDLGNRRVVVFEYDKDTVRCVNSFGSQKGDFRPLMVPNGITIVKKMVDGQAKFFVWVNDEFYHTKTDGRNRCVKFDEDGNYVAHFKTVRNTNGDKYDLYWPQGLSSDEAGNLYIANTGSYEILKCHAKREFDKANRTLIVEEGSILLHSFGNPKGMGQLNVMRSVSVIDDKIFVPDRKVNEIAVYDLNGTLLTSIKSMTPRWQHEVSEADSLDDFFYSYLEDRMLVDPYQVCKGEADDVYFITEPYLSRVCKVRIPIARRKPCKAELIADVGKRRDNVDKKAGTSQFNGVTSVIGLDERFPQKSERASSSSLPAYVKYNPFQQGYMAWSKLFTFQYQWWYSALPQGFCPHRNNNGKATILNLDAGNWTIKAYTEKDNRFQQEPGAVAGIYVPGGMAAAVYYPSEPLLGQICPGTPILFVTNYSLCTVTMYQFNPLGQLVNYGLPFGIRGRFEVCGLLSPQGIAVNRNGEIFIADCLNDRISKWQILQTGQVIFIKTFKWKEENFTPSDVAVDKQNRVFVCDQFNNVIRVFDSDGKSLWSYGKGGYCDKLDEEYDEFFLPTSIAIDDDHIIVNDLVNRMLKVFKICDNTLEYATGMECFNKHPEDGGLWMPFFIYADEGRVYVPDTTFNVVNVYEYNCA